MLKNCILYLEFLILWGDIHFTRVRGDSHCWGGGGGVVLVQCMFVVGSSHGSSNDVDKCVVVVPEALIRWWLTNLRMNHRVRVSLLQLTEIE